MRNRKVHAGIFAFEEQTGDAEGDETIVIPEDITSIEDEALQALEDQTVAAFDELYDSGVQEASTVSTLGDLAAAIQAVRGEKTRRAAERQEAADAATSLREQVHAESPEGEGDGDDPEGGDGGDGGDDPEAAVDPAAAPAPEPELVTAAARPQPQTQPATPKRVTRINVPFSEIRKRQPGQDAPPQLTITAASDVPRYTAGHQFAGVHELAEAFSERAKSTALSNSGNTTGPKVATIRREFEHVVSNETSASDLTRILKEITSPDALVAAGGWCAPSEIMYDFFDITCEDGMIDLPTMGITRGGIRFPVSPSFGDVFDGTFNNTTNPWLWTEVDDILAVTGTGVKPCIRVPCPTFDERRLECYGICLTAGNLTDNAYPEATQNQLALLQSAHFHAINSQYIATMLAFSTPVVSGAAFNGHHISVDLPAAVGWAAIDYRTRYGMCEDAILEIVLPVWAREPMRTDLASRNGVAELAVSNAEIADWFDVRSVRVQWVNDWQIRGASQPGGPTPTVNYPATVQFMLYAAGTFVRGNGMTLDLGVVRDSVLNETNDHTAAWTEECHLIARIGHESRLYTVPICAAGRSGAADITACRTL